MRDDYLWDGSGEPDPEIQQLETALGKLRHKRPLVFSEIPGWKAQTARPRFWRTRLFPRFAIAAAAVLVAGTVAFWLFYPKSDYSKPGWEVTRVAGEPKVGSHALGEKSGTGKLVLGQTLETDGRSQANIRDEDVGQIVVDPDTRLRVNAAGIRRLSLDRGTIHASIWAPAGEFVIDTPSAVAVDLGCAYTLHVDDNGDGVLHTTLGWVGFKLADHESFIPAGAACPTKRNRGPGIPFFEDSTQEFRSALSKLEVDGASQEEKNEALKVMLAQSRQRDALSLWHLLSRVPEPDRGQVYDRLIHFVPAPAGVTRDGILHLNQNMLDLWWNELGFGDVSLWRHWERGWADESSK